MALNLARPVDYNIKSVDFSPIADVGLAYKAKQDKEALMENAKQVASSGNPSAMRDFAIENPNLGKMLYEISGIQDEQAQGRMLELTKALTASGDPVADLKSHIEAGRQSGRDMTHSEKLLTQSGGDPEKLTQMVEMSLAVQDPAAFNAIQKTKPQQAEPMTAYQAAMVDSKKIDQALRREEALLKREENKLKKETDELKVNDLKNKIDERKQKIEDAKREKNEKEKISIDASRGLISRIDELSANTGYIDSLTGYRGRLPVSATDEGIEAEALFDNITDSLTLDNLKLMTGVLTDKDIQLLKSAASGLKRGMGAERFREILGDIKTQVKAKLDLKSTSGAEVDTPQAVEATQAVGQLSDEDLLKKYGG